ncbi:MAG TPA: hypothetical protein VLK29_07150 [Luteimonas sp.]|nr:hypothetical protein [Luteimonas sp.]
MQASDRTPQTQPTRRHWPDRTAHRHRRLARKAFGVVAVLLVVLPWLGYRQLRSALSERDPASAAVATAQVAPAAGTVPAAASVAEAPPARTPGASAKPSEAPGDGPVAIAAAAAGPALLGPGNALARERARAEVQRIVGVRAAGWLDRERLLVVVEHNDLRTDATIGTVCARLAASADTTGIEVQVQSAAAATAAELTLLGRRCRDAADAVQPVARPVDDGLDALRAQVLRDSDESASDPSRGDRNAESMRILESTTPQL